MRPSAESIVKPPIERSYASQQLKLVVWHHASGSGANFRTKSRGKSQSLAFCAFGALWFQLQCLAARELSMHDRCQLGHGLDAVSFEDTMQQFDMFRQTVKLLTRAAFILIVPVSLDWYRRLAVIMYTNSRRIHGQHNWLLTGKHLILCWSSSTGHKPACLCYRPSLGLILSVSWLKRGSPSMSICLDLYTSTCLIICSMKEILYCGFSTCYCRLMLTGYFYMGVRCDLKEHICWIS